jgi:hypothetical protein
MESNALCLGLPGVREESLEKAVGWLSGVQSELAGNELWLSGDCFQVVSI